MAELHYIPCWRDNEDSNAYLTFWDGQSWSDGRRIDPGTAFDPSHMDVDIDSTGLAHIAWSKYDSYSRRYTIYYTTSDGSQESNIVLIWQSDQEQEPFSILKPVIVVDATGAVTIAFETSVDGIWRTYFTSRP